MRRRMRCVTHREPHASKVSRRVELMTTALKTTAPRHHENSRERLVVMTAGAQRQGVGERMRDEKRDKSTSARFVYFKHVAHVIVDQAHGHQRSRSQRVHLDREPSTMARVTHKAARCGLRSARRRHRTSVPSLRRGHANLLCNRPNRNELDRSEIREDLLTGTAATIEPKGSRNERGGEG